MREPQVLKEAVENARTFLSFRVERALASSELKTGEGRARAAEAALAMVAEHPNELVRDQFLVTVSDRTRLDPERLRPRLEALVRAFEASGRQEGEAGKSRQRPVGVLRRGTSLGAGRGGGLRPAGRRRGQGGPRLAVAVRGRWRPEPEQVSDALVLAVREPGAMAGRLHEALFADALQRTAFKVLLGSASLHEAIEAADDEVADLLRRLAVTEPDADPDQTVVALARAAARSPSARLRRPLAKPRPKATRKLSPGPAAPSPG